VVPKRANVEDIDQAAVTHASKRVSHRIGRLMKVGGDLLVGERTVPL
jgi:hypothetical protein